jgi:hypothetical protein
MSPLLKIVAAGAVIATGLAFAPLGYAGRNPQPDSHAPSMGRGMGHGGMMGMQGGMMGQMSQMMDNCNTMMQSRNQPPNSQYRKPRQSTPRG